MTVIESFRAFADCLREPAVLVATTGEVLALNGAAAALLGITSTSSTMAFRLADFLHGGGAALDDFVRACSRTRQSIFASLALRSPAGDSVSYRVEGLLYREASHDNPATVFLRLLRQEVATAPLVALDERIRAFGRGRAGGPRVLAINDVVSAISALVRPLLGDEVELVTRLDPDPPLVHVDPAQLERILVNLAVHAHDVMPEGGRVVIETGQRTVARREGALPTGRYATITFRDSGPQLTPEEDARLFLPFAPTTSLPQGSGISLASSLATLRELGGDIEVHSAAETGTAFVLLVPEAAASTAAEAAPEPAPESVTVLVVDDDDNTRDLIVDSLRSAGFTVLGASDGPAAIEIARSRAAGGIDLLVTDVVMPRMTGPRVAQALRQTSPNARVLYVSGYTDHQDLPVDARSGFLAKPFTRGALVGRVKAMLDA